MDVVRINSAHLDPEGVKKIVANVRSVSDKIAILLDTKGPEIRTTTCDEPIKFIKGRECCNSRQCGRENIAFCD